jgi:Tol biopolymer transport system component
MARLVVVAAMCVGLVAGLAVSAQATQEPRIAYWSDSPIPSLWTVRPDGSGRDEIGRLRNNAKRPDVSPNGRFVAFDGAPPGTPAMRDFNIQLMHLDGTGLRVLTRGSGALDVDARWSPDGRTLSFSRMPGGDWKRARVHLVDTRTGAVRFFTRGQFARWAPGGTRLVVDAPTAESDGDLFLVSADGRTRERLTSTKELEQPTDWSRDGRKILFTRYFSEGGSDVFELTLASRTERRLTHGGRSASAVWSPAGRRIAFTQEEGAVTRLVVARRDGTGRRYATPPGVNAFEPTWG